MGSGGVRLTPIPHPTHPPQKIILKKPSLIRVNNAKLLHLRNIFFIFLDKNFTKSQKDFHFSYLRLSKLCMFWVYRCLRIKVTKFGTTKTLKHKHQKLLGFNVYTIPINLFRTNVPTETTYLVCLNQITGLCMNQIMLKIGEFCLIFIVIFFFYYEKHLGFHVSL